MDYQETSYNVYQSEGLRGIEDWEEVFKLGRRLKKPVAVLDFRNGRYADDFRAFPVGWANVWMPIPDQTFDVMDEFKALDFFRAAGRAARSFHESGYILWILCAAGISRSTAANIAFRMMAYQEDRDTAFMAIRNKRSCVGPNVFFWSILLKLEQEVHGRTISTMPASEMYAALCD